MRKCQFKFVAYIGIVPFRREGLNKVFHQTLPFDGRSFWSSTINLSTKKMMMQDAKGMRWMERDENSHKKHKTQHHVIISCCRLAGTNSRRSSKNSV